MLSDNIEVSIVVEYVEDVDKLQINLFKLLEWMTTFGMAMNVDKYN